MWFGNDYDNRDWGEEEFTPEELEMLEEYYADQEVERMLEDEETKGLDEIIKL